MGFVALNPIFNTGPAYGLLLEVEKNVVVRQDRDAPLFKHPLSRRFGYQAHTVH